jgi:hypothetical protein
MPEMNVTSVPATTTNNEQPTMNLLKQSQTKPILPAVKAGKIALSLSKGLLKSLTSSAGKFAPSAVEGPVTTNLVLSEACGERSRTAEGPIE